MRVKQRTAVLLACMVLAACGGDEDPANNSSLPEVETPADDACHHMASGPNAQLTAGADAAEAPTVSDSHTRYDVVLPGEIGVVVLQIDEQNEAHLFFDTDVELEVTDGSGMSVTLTEDIPDVEECDEVVEGFAYDLGVGSYTLTITSPAPEVSMVFVPSNAGDEDQH